MKKIIFLLFLSPALFNCTGDQSAAEKIRQMDSTVASEENLVMSKAEMIEDLVKTGMTEEEAKTQMDIIDSYSTSLNVTDDIQRELMRRGMSEEDAKKEAAEMRKMMKEDSLEQKGKR